jgi:hypothetical protein
VISESRAGIVFVTIMPESLELELDSLLKQSQNKSWTKPLPEELSHLLCAFLSSQPAELRSKAYLVLSTVCQHIRESSPQLKGEEADPATESLVKLFALPVASRFAELGENDVLIAVSFLTALFQVDWQSASSIFRQNAVFDSIIDLIDLSPSTNISHELASLLSQACAHKSCRDTISSSPHCRRWLEQGARQTTDTAFRSSAAVALIKLSRGYAADSRDIPGGDSQPQTSTNDSDLILLMTELVVKEEVSSSTTDAIEGLAYMSTEPQVKENLSTDTPFLVRLFDRVPRPKKSTIAPPSSLSNTSQMYGIVVIISNICAYRPRLSQEQAQIAKLRSMSKAKSATSGNFGDAKEDLLETDEYVRERCRRMVRAGVVDALSALVRVTDSRGVFAHVGKALLSLAEDKDNRGKILQSGGSRALVTIIRTSLSSSSSPVSQVDDSILEPIQALAKLAITASPVQVFGPDEGPSLDAIRPLSLMLVHPSSNLLQQFEALMALTNLSSSSPNAASHVAKADGLMNKVELFLLEDHELVRRAAMELICNLIAGSDEVYDKYGGQAEKASSKSKLQVLVALSDVEDGATRLAASGALATITSSPNACKALLDLQMDRHRVFPILAQLVNPARATDEIAGSKDSVVNAGLVHRGIICVRNLIGCLDDSSLRSLVPDAQSSGLVASLVGVVKSNAASSNMTILQPAAETLKLLLDAGASVTET